MDRWERGKYEQGPRQIQAKSRRRRVLLQRKQAQCRTGLCAPLAVNGGQTSKRAELTAILHVLKTEKRRVLIKTESRYACEGINEWMHRWKAKAWLQSAASATSIKNVDLWKQIYQTN